MAGKNRRTKQQQARTEHFSRRRTDHSSRRARARHVPHCRRNERSSRRTQDSLSSLREQLANHIGVLRAANSSLMVCVQALQQQNAEMDVDIARVLQRYVSDPLDAATEGIEALDIAHD